MNRAEARHAGSADGPLLLVKGAHAQSQITRAFWKEKTPLTLDGPAKGGVPAAPHGTRAGDPRQVVFVRLIDKRAGIMGG